MLKPTATLSIDTPIVKLEDQVPRHFGEWQALDEGLSQVVSPQVERRLEIFYADTLSRTYQNANGDRIMLSLAYGRIQNRELQVHKPEVCYVSQGFQIKGLQKADLDLGTTTLPTMRLIAVQGARHEPITYWIRSGDEVVRGWYEQNRARISAGFRGIINDGLLVRVSSISDDSARAFEVQERFIRDLLLAIQPAHQYMFLGKRQG